MEADPRTTQVVQAYADRLAAATHQVIILTVELDAIRAELDATKAATAISADS